jgi:hypothetical protein
MAACYSLEVLVKAQCHVSSRKKAATEVAPFPMNTPGLNTSLHQIDQSR